MQYVAIEASKIHPCAKSIDFEVLFQHLKNIEANQERLIDVYVQSGEETAFLQKAAIGVSGAGLLVGVVFRCSGAGSSRENSNDEGLDLANQGVQVEWLRGFQFIRFSLRALR